MEGERENNANRPTDTDHPRSQNGYQDEAPSLPSEERRNGVHASPSANSSSPDLSLPSIRTPPVPLHEAQQSRSSRSAPIRYVNGQVIIQNTHRLYDEPAPRGNASDLGSTNPASIHASSAKQSPVDGRHDAAASEGRQDSRPASGMYSTPGRQGSAPLLHGLHVLSNEQDALGWTRLRRYYEYCDTYRTQPCPHIAVAFRYPVITCLQLPETVTLADLLPLADMLAYDNVFTSLDLHRCQQLGNGAAYTIGAALKSNGGLHELNLSYQDIGEHGIVALAEGLEASRTMQRVFLRGNRIGVVGACALGRLIRKTKSITYMDVSNNYLRIRGVHEITRAMLLRAQARLAAKWAKAQHHHLSELWERQLQQDPAALGPPELMDPLPLPGQPDSAIPRPKPVRSTLAGAGVGWLWGNASNLVVTSNYVVRTNFATAWGTSAQSAGVNGEPLEGAGSPTAQWTGRRRSRRASRADRTDASAAPAEAARTGIAGGDRQRHRSRSASSDSKTSEPPADGDDVDVDIEVRINGNFVQEEVFNSIVHGIGFVLSVIGAFPLLSQASVSGDRNRFIGTLAYIIGLVAFFASSTLNHSLFLTDASAVFRLIDHSAVYVLIAGTYTPFLLQNFVNMQPLAGGLLCGVYFLAAVGVLMSTLWGGTEEEPPSRRGMRVALYIAMGYLGVVPFFFLRHCVAATGWWVLAAGGLIFSCGTIQFFRQQHTRPHEPHGWWYVFVLLACLLHWWAIYMYVHPPSPYCTASETAYRLGLVWTPPGNGTVPACPGGVETCAAPNSSSLEFLDFGIDSDATVAQALMSTAAKLTSVAANVAVDGTQMVKDRTIAMLRQVIEALENSST